MKGKFCQHKRKKLHLTQLIYGNYNCYNIQVKLNMTFDVVLCNVII